MVFAAYQSPASIAALRRISPLQEHLRRLARAVTSLALFTVQLPLIAFDTILNTSYYGRPSWNFKFRALRLLAGYAIWSINPGTRPARDVQSFAARSAVPSLKKTQRASLVVIPERKDKLFGDALHEIIVPESCPCFWQWLDSMPSPLDKSQETPVNKAKVMVYLVGGGMVQGHPIQSPLPWKVMQVTRIPIFGVNFRKCVVKETAFPAALQDAVAGFFYLLGEGYLAENISFIGDSGGGCILLTTLLYLLKQKLPVPGSAILISPWADLKEDYTTDRELLNLDILNPEMLSTASYQYTENRPDLRATLLSPSRNELPEGYSFEGFPRTLLNYGDAEMFAPSNSQLGQCLLDAKVDVDIVVGRDEVHVYPYLTTNLEADSFYRTLAKFVHL